MTLLDAPQSTRSVPVDPAGPRRRPLRRALIVVMVLLLVAGSVVGGLAARDAVALSQVHVFLDARPFTCADPSDVTTIARGDSDGDGSYSVPAVKGDLALDCTLSVVVRNDSDVDVDVDRITLPGFGPGFFSGLSSDRSQTQGLTPHRSGADSTDVVYDYADEAPIGVVAGGVQRFEIHLVSDGCRQAGGTITWDDSPVVTVATGLATADRDREGVGFGLLGVRTAAQPCR